jgi:hypothetical protein
LHGAGKLVAFALAGAGCFVSAPAVACLCSCPLFAGGMAHSAQAEVAVDGYDQIFSGFVISTERTNEPVSDPPISAGENLILDPGYWARSNILVLRVWRGAPPTVAEVWTPVLTDCESPPISGFYFDALVRTEKGRRVASNSPCGCDERAAATKERGTFTVAGLSIGAAAILAFAVVLGSLARIVRRRVVRLKSAPG